VGHGSPALESAEDATRASAVVHILVGYRAVFCDTVSARLGTECARRLEGSSIRDVPDGSEVMMCETSREFLDTGCARWQRS
jgi:hypothetical protein